MGVKKKIILRAENLHKEFPTGKGEALQVLRGIDIEIGQSEIVVIIGPSGSGKSTLLHLLSALDRPTLGKVFFEENDLVAMNERETTSFRNAMMGFVFQFHHLLPEFTAVENVAMPALIQGYSMRDVREKAMQLLNEVGVSERAGHRPSALSGGEQQRVAVARAMMNGPKIIFADEPSGNLDEENGIKLHTLLVQLARQRGLTFVIATHNPDMTKRADRVLRLSEGKLSLVRHAVKSY
ncbi:MAG: ABC transporter ATP-binding protein [Ignavibacteriae bacterium]|nr:ABC transporter ATP-binding protein [Ignavibacteriota bacterium]